MKLWLMAMVAVVVLGSGGWAWAGRPLTVDDADPADSGWVEVEAGVAYAKDASTYHGDLPLGLSVGAGGGWEFGVGAGGQWEKAEGDSETDFSDVGLGAKWRIVEACDGALRLAVIPSVTLPVADEDKGLGSGETDYDLTWAVSFSPSEVVGLHGNAGYAWIGEDGAGDVVHYGVVMDYAWTERVQGVAELFVEDERQAGTDTLVMVNAGLRWTASDSLVLDVAGGVPVDGRGPDFTATAGLTFAFDLNRAE